MKLFRLITPLLLTILLTACSATATDVKPQTDASQPAPEPVSVSTETPSSSADLTRIDQQGTVIVNALPLNLNTPSDQLDFQVVLDTHSVELSMDLATMSTLTTDTGITVQATLWDAERGGHHVQGILIFPASVDGKSVLEGASTLTLTITDLDAPSRIFEWQLQ